jgi:hypothetical protein
MNTSPVKALLFCLALTACAKALCQKPGDLVITPTRVLLDDKTRSGDIMLVNRGSQTIRYRLTLVDMQMSEEGAMKRVASSENSAVPILRLSPREVVLDPGVSQRIKIAAYFPKGSADQELRSHLSFEPIALPKILGPQSPPQTGGLKLNFEMRSVVTIPVIAQHGRLIASGSLSECSAVQDLTGSAVRFKITRTGSRTIRGDVAVTFIPAAGGPKVVVGQISGLPVYFPNADRIVTIRLTRDISSLGKGELEISFAEQERSRGATVARAVIELPK